MIDTVEDYISGNITVDQALGKLRYTSPNNQICILSQSLLDKYLRFVDSERLNDIREGRPVCESKCFGERSPGLLCD